MKICPNCQSEYSDEVNFCIKCGTSLVIKPVQTVKNTNNTAVGPLQDNPARDNRKHRSFSFARIASHLFYIVVILGLFFVIYYEWSEKEYLSWKTEDLQKDLNDRDRILNGYLNRSDSKAPFFIGSIDVRNDDQEWDEPIYHSNSTYISSRLQIYSRSSGEYVIDVKFYTPYGMSQGSTSPADYSFSDTIDVDANNVQTIGINGWGGEDKGHWDSGDYRLEYYFNGYCLATKCFTVQ